MVTGAYPPIKCGVGDYTFQLANSLSKLPRVSVGVLTSILAVPSSDQNLSVINAIRSWSLWYLPKILRTIVQFGPDIVHIQYPTQGCAAPMLLPLVLRVFGYKVVQTWHEHYCECSAIGLPNLFACRAIIHVRHDLPSKLPYWMKRLFGTTRQRLVHIPNDSSIPITNLSAAEAELIKVEYVAEKSLVCFFGFAYPNKGIERLFEIADPLNHHLVLVCDLNENDPYQSRIRCLTEEARWNGCITVTGFLPASRVAEILAVADCVVFPFPDGTGDWNTSLRSAERAGAFTIATTKETQLLGYNEERNIAFTSCDDLAGMRRELLTRAGTRKLASQQNEWQKIAQMHEQVYQDCM